MSSELSSEAFGCHAIYYYNDGGWSICILSRDHEGEHQRSALAVTTNFPGHWVERPSK